MNLKKLFVAEIAIVTIIIVFIAFAIELTPYLSNGEQTGQIGVFNQREYARKTVTLSAGQRESSQFNYTTYDPAILVVDIEFHDWQRSGYLSLYCNGILIVTFEATPNNPYVELTTVTFSGFDIVKPPPPKLPISFAFAYGNEVSFLHLNQTDMRGLLAIKSTLEEVDKVGFKINSVNVSGSNNVRACFLYCKPNFFVYKREYFENHTPSSWVTQYSRWEP